MWAAQITEFNTPYTISTVNIPQLRPNELLVKYTPQILPLPLIPSHEPVGTVVQVGEESASKWKDGDRVGILRFKNACDTCAGYRRSRKRYGTLDPRFCDHRETGGIKNDGCFATYMVADSATTIALPDSVSFEQGAPLLCAGATVWGAINKARPFLQAGDMIAYGRHDMPTELQPDHLITSTHDDACEKILERTGVVLLGLPPEPWRFDTHPIVFRQLVLRGSYVASREEVEEMMAVVDQHGVRSQLKVVKKDDILQVPEMYLSRSFRGCLVVRFD
ncbi:chaperonin 10-like protein [Aspergillus pseudonomiae]|uniref:Chaperonin 10-like protein n=1 Tax=Aspergillus pseudonomiae TaxID=1506151 RepID=A0A5N7DKQ8_9EURO|nr:chaperonin 10-like protein [Aspergillus pseudonomiae]KAE8407030.1 chaperonin 10-like protein [Aspergillus pseudonomiae]